jgi:hypothetical protein
VHVDIVKNEWLTGEQQPIARLFLGKGQLQIDSPDPARWGPIVEEALGARDMASADPTEVLEQATHLIRGSHLFATAPHEHDACPYRGWASVRMESVSSEQPVGDRQAARL